MNSQEALENIRKQIPNIKDGTDFVYSVDTLQELIDNYNKMSNEFDILLDTNNQLEKEYIELSNKLNKKQILFESVTTKLVKALDKACNEIVYLENTCMVYSKRCGCNVDGLFYKKGKLGWKDYLLKESERECQKKL